MAAKYANFNGGGNLTIQESQATFIEQAIFEPAVATIADGLHGGHSPSILSILRPDLLNGFARAWLVQKDDPPEVTPTESYKNALYGLYAPAAMEGDPAAILALPKFATTLGRLTVSMELAVEYGEAVAAWQSDRPYLQYLGTFDPQHIGHRIGVQSALAIAGEDASVVAHVMGEHPRKRNLQSPYDIRYTTAEQRFYASPLIDNKRLTHVDMPGGVGLANAGLEQMKLLADLTGDQKLRWVIGSDKLLLDTNALKAGHAPQKTITRITDPRMHVYVIDRQLDDRSQLDAAAAYASDRFGTPITIIDELPYDCAPASSSKVKELRAQGRYQEADHMELYELQP